MYIQKIQLDVVIREGALALMRPPGITVQT